MATTGSALLGENPAVLIAGPTASGKSARRAGHRPGLRRHRHQCRRHAIYRELGILTARPSAAEEREVPHRLYGHRSAREPWSAGSLPPKPPPRSRPRWQRQALPVITGGTGLYLGCWSEGLTPFPPIPAEIRQRWREALRRDGVVALHSRLAPEDRQAIRPERSAAGCCARSRSPRSPAGRRAPCPSCGPGDSRGSSLLRLAIVPDRARLYDGSTGAPPT